MATIKLTNSRIYEIASNLIKQFDVQQQNNLYLPTKISFYLCKNINLFTELATEIEEQQQKIITHFGIVGEGGQVSFPGDSGARANQEYAELMNLEQEVSIYQVPLQALETLNLSMAQIDALMFMIKEEGE